MSYGKMYGDMLQGFIFAAAAFGFMVSGLIALIIVCVLKKYGVL